MSVFASLVTSLSDALEPVFRTSATAAAIVACTLLVRLALHPLARAAVRGERARATVAPRIAALQREYRDDPERLSREVREAHTAAGVSPVAGCLPTLLQLPVFFAMYHLFTSGGTLLDHTLLGAPLGGRWADTLGAGGPFGGPGLVYLALFGLTAAVATWTFMRTRRLRAAGRAANGGTGAEAEGPAGAAAVARFVPLLSFGTLVTVAVVPLAAALYVVTSTAWTAVERAALGAGKPPEPAARSAQGARSSG